MIAPTDREKEISRRLKVDMEVIGADGNHIGHIKQVRPTQFLLHRPESPSIFVPYSAVDTFSEIDNRVVLNVPEGRIAEMDWPGLESDESVLKPLGGT